MATSTTCSIDDDADRLWFCASYFNAYGVPNSVPNANTYGVPNSIAYTNAHGISNSVADANNHDVSNSVADADTYDVSNFVTDADARCLTPRTYTTANLNTSANSGL